MEKTNVYTKLQKIQSEIKELVRTEENKFQKYKFFNELQVLKLLKPLLEKFKIVILLNDDTSQPFVHEKGEKEHFIKYLKKLEIVDAEAPENRLIFSFWACGSNIDLAKAKGSAETYATKYILTKLFLIPVRDTIDPDYQGSEKEEITSEERKTVNDFFKKHGMK